MGSNVTSLPVDLAGPLGRFMSRYQRALLLRMGVVSALGLGVCAAIAWKLGHAGLGAGWRHGVVVGGLALTAAAMWLWWRRGRLPVRAACSQLDRSLSLQERLTTIEEFASATPTPVLYPMLVQETARVLSAARGPAVPKPVTRTAIVLALLLLLALFWPLGTPPMRVAGVPPSPMTQPQPPPTPEPQPSPSAQDQQRDQQNNAGAGQGPQQQPSTGQDQSQGGSQGQQSRNGQRGEGRDQEGREGASGGDTARGSQEGQPQSAQDGASQDQAQTGSDASQDGARERQGEQTRAEQQRDGSQPRDGDSRDGSEQRGMDQASQRSDGSGGSAQEQAQRVQERARAQAAQGQRGGSQGAATAGDQQAMKAQIQELLQEMSGELEQLQSDLASKEQGPQAGTGTDPELFGPPELPETEGRRTAPIGLRTDEAQTSRQRRGGGVSAPSGQVDERLPELQPEDAQLSSTSEEVAPVDRQTVPPPYRSIFDRLFHRPATQEPSTQ